MLDKSYQTLFTKPVWFIYLVFYFYPFGLCIGKTHYIPVSWCTETTRNLHSNIYTLRSMNAFAKQKLKSSVKFQKIRWHTKQGSNSLSLMAFDHPNYTQSNTVPNKCSNKIIRDWYLSYMDVAITQKCPWLHGELPATGQNCRLPNLPCRGGKLYPVESSASLEQWCNQT